LTLERAVDTLASFARAGISRDVRAADSRVIARDETAALTGAVDFPERAACWS
jgi:hypothetical protein